MLEHLRQLAVFAKTVETGSFRGAAKALDLSPSVVSHHISRLEKNLGVALLYRSTRRLRLTEDGEKLLDPARRMLDSAQEGLNTISRASPEPSGRLKITAPAVLVHSRLVELIAAFAQAYPKVDLEISFTDSQRDIIADGLDVSMRMGWLKDSSLKARKLSDEDLVLVAATSYIASKPKPTTPQALETWDWVHLQATPRHVLIMSRNGQTERLAIANRFVVDDALARLKLLCAGVGVGALPRFLVEPQLASGELQIVLETWRPNSPGIYAVWPPNSPRDGLTQRFVAFLTKNWKYRFQAPQ
ncbi:LysR family transcriptional regulator [Pelagibius sp. Alg239-R121]|uniref:LysR family transcriptional regulator n=1 Tax=Pelagibius sp. Alg239-R121 TaxID=2993448 RepID=UPI0024A6633B|nr:LysR family transcriptional regulator [Pelagibius sp. Alg239-R121]